MGYTLHHTIIVTGQNPDIAEAWEKALEIFSPVMVVSELTLPVSNGYQSFAVWPDGSKEGWPASNEGDSHRAALISYLNSKCVDWVEIQFADGDTKVVADSSKAHSTRHAFKGRLDRDCELCGEPDRHWQHSNKDGTPVQEPQ